MIYPIDAVGGLPLAQPAAPSEVTKAGDTFGRMVADSLHELNGMQQQADKAMQQLHTGGERDLHEVMIAMEKADISLRYTVQIRNKALEAYQEIMRLQV